MIAFMVAGTASGVGKTTCSLALMAAFRRRGLAVQPFKCGPDFIDTGHHTTICGRSSRNLDTWMLSRQTNLELFSEACAGADVAVVEGMMGLFDGAGGETDESSSAEIAKLLDIPVVLVLDASKSSRSIAAVVKGFETFDAGVRFGGILLNGVAGDQHFRLLEPAIASNSNVPILGWLPRDLDLTMPERHLGLHTADERTDWPRRCDALAAFAEAHLNLDLLLHGESWSHAIPAARPSKSSAREERIRVAVARDRAFSFYYQDNFNLLSECGAELIGFSPLFDEQIPEDADAIYLGGGYPELYAQVLSENRGLLAGIRRFAEDGKPIYAECGGLIYLAESLTTLNGESFSMAGVLPLHIAMTSKLVHFGYAEVEFTEDCLLGEKGTTARGHSFHCSEAAITGPMETRSRVRYSLSGREEAEGYSLRNVLASYIHLHFRANPDLAASFVKRASLARRPAEAVL